MAGITKLITVFTPLISNPLAATSVANKISISSFLNFVKFSRRCGCVRLPWSSPT